MNITYLVKKQTANFQTSMLDWIVDRIRFYQYTIEFYENWDFLSNNIYRLHFYGLHNRIDRMNREELVYTRAFLLTYSIYISTSSVNTHLNKLGRYSWFKKFYIVINEMKNSQPSTHSIGLNTPPYFYDKFLIIYTVYEK